MLEATKCKLKPQSLATITFLLQLLCEYAGTSTNREMGKQLEYRYLIKHEKYWETW